MKVQVSEDSGKVNIELSELTQREGVEHAEVEEQPEYFGFGQTIKEFCLSRDGKQVIVITPDDSMVVHEKSFNVDLRTLDSERLFGVLDCDFFDSSEVEIRAMIDGIRKLAGDHERRT